MSEAVTAPATETVPPTAKAEAQVSLTPEEKKLYEERKAAKKAAKEARANETPEEKEARRKAKEERRAKETPEETAERKKRGEVWARARQAERAERRAQREADLARWKKEAEAAAQIKREGYKKFEEAASLRKQFASIRDVVTSNPAAGLLEMAKIFGLSEDVVEEMFQNRVQWQQQWAKMNDDQKARYMAEQKAAQLQQEQEARLAQEQEQKAQTELAQKQDAFEKKLAAQVVPQMESAGLKPTHLKLKLVAATLGAIADRDGPDQEPDIGEAVAYVAEAYGKDLDETVRALDPATFERRYPEQMERLRKYWLAKATGTRAAPSGDGRPQAAPRATPRENEGNISSKTSWSDVSRMFKNIQKGVR